MGLNTLQFVILYLRLGLMSQQVDPNAVKQFFQFLFQELKSVKEEGGNAVEKKETESAEDEKEADTKETAITITGDEQKQDGTNTEEEKPVEKADGDKEGEKPDGVAVEESEHVSVPIEDEGKTESAEGGEGEVKPGSNEGGEGEASREVVEAVTLETTVINETETGVDHSKYEELDDELPWAMYRSMDTPPNRPPVEEDDDWPTSDDEGDYGIVFVIICILNH